MDGEELVTLVPHTSRYTLKIWRMIMGNMTILEAIAGYFALVLVFAGFNLFNNISSGKLKLTFGVLVAHMIAAIVAGIAFSIMYLLIFWIHKGAAFCIGSIVATVIGTGVLNGTLSSLRDSLTPSPKDKKSVLS